MRVRRYFDLQPTRVTPSRARSTRDSTIAVNKRRAPNASLVHWQILTAAQLVSCLRNSLSPSGLGHLGDSPALLAWPRSPRISALHSRLGESPNCLQQMVSYFRDRTLTPFVAVQAPQFHRARNRSIMSDVEALIAEHHDAFFRMPEIQTSRFVITSRRFISCSISCRPPE